MVTQERTPLEEEENAKMSVKAYLKFNRPATLKWQRKKTRSVIEMRLQFLKCPRIYSVHEVRQCSSIL